MLQAGQEAQPATRTLQNLTCTVSIDGWAVALGDDGARGRSLIRIITDRAHPFADQPRNFVARLSTAEKIAEAIWVIFWEPTRNTCAPS